MIYLNGEYMPIEEARIPVLDRGFIFGDGVYEVIPVYSRKPFRIEEHLSRLEHSLNGIRLENPHSGEEWKSIIHRLIALNEPEDQSLYLHITRGVAKRDHAFPKGVKPTIFMMPNPLVTPSPQTLESGVSAITAEDNRWLRCDIKAISLLPNVLLRQLAIDSGAAETLLFRGNFLTEGAASNIFVVSENTLLAPPKDNLMLPGITYDVVLELAQGQGMPFEVRRISKEEVCSASELLLTSSTREVTPITLLDGKAVGSGKPGPFFARLHDAYQAFKHAVMRRA